MITKGIIKSINFLSNTCVVRLPLYESVRSSEVTAKATFSIAPGIYNGYKVGDVVFVDFEDNRIELPVIIGKLFISVNDEKTSYRGSISADSIDVKNDFTLPTSTKIRWDGKDSKTVGVDGNFSSYKTLGDILTRLKQTENSLNDARIQFVNDGSNLGVRLTQLEEDSSRHDSEIMANASEILNRVTWTDPNGLSEGFGWNLDKDSWTIFSEAGSGEIEESGTTRRAIMKVTDSGLWLGGAITIEGYNREVLSRYRKTDFSTTPPEWPAGWNDWDYRDPTDPTIGWFEKISDCGDIHDGEYIWQWQKISNGSGWTDLGKACISGTQGLPGFSPYIDENTGNWITSTGDTGVHAQGPAGDDGVSLSTIPYYRRTPMATTSTAKPTAETSSSSEPTSAKPWTTLPIVPNVGTGDYNGPKVWVSFVTTVGDTVDWNSATTPVEYQTLEGFVSILESNGIDIISYSGGEYHLKADTLTGAVGDSVQIGGKEIGGTWYDGFVIKSATSSTAAAIHSNSKNSYTTSGAGVYLGTDGIALGDTFKVDKNGNVTATSANITGTINAQAGSFNGTITASGGTIGGFTIGTNSIYNDKTYLADSHAGIYIGTDGISLGAGKSRTDTAAFEVRKNGSIYIRNYLNHSNFTTFFKNDSKVRELLKNDNDFRALFAATKEGNIREVANNYSGGKWLK